MSQQAKRQNESEPFGPDGVSPTRRLHQSSNISESLVAKCTKPRLASYQWRIVTSSLVVHDTWPHGWWTVQQSLVHDGRSVAHEDVWSRGLIKVVWSCSQGDAPTAASTQRVRRLMADIVVVVAAAAWLWHVRDGCRRRWFRCWRVPFIQHFRDGCLKWRGHVPPLQTVQDIVDVDLFVGRHFVRGFRGSSLVEGLGANSCQS